MSVGPQFESGTVPPGPRSASALLLLCLLLAGQAAAQETVLRGRVVTIDNHPAPDARIQIVGQVALLPIRSPSGEFEQPLAGHPGYVELAVASGSMRILFPLDGRLLIPKDPRALVTIVVGKTEKDAIGEALAARLLTLESTLKGNGIQFDAALDSLSGDLHQVLDQLQLREGDLRSQVVFKREQASLNQQLLRAIDKYILEVHDLRDAFLNLGPLAPREPGAMQSLQTALGEYNAAFEALNDDRHGYASGIRDYWGGDRGEVLSKYLDDLYIEAIDNIHKGIVLPTNPSLIQLQLAYGRKRPSQREIDDAVRALLDAGHRLEGRFDALEQRAAELRGALERD